MNNEHSPLDSDSRSLLQELAATPVSRRWMLKAGLGSAAAMALQLPSGPAVAAQTRVSRSSRLPLHFALGTATGVTDLVLVANGGRIPLVPHTAASRAALRARGGLWRVMDLSALTHYVSAVPLPTERSMAVSVYGRRGQAEVVVSQLWCIPPKATRALALAAYRLTRSLESVHGSPARLKALGLVPAQISSPEYVVQLESIGDPHQTAIALRQCRRMAVLRSSSQSCRIWASTYASAPAGSSTKKSPPTVVQRSATPASANCSWAATTTWG